MHMTHSSPFHLLLAAVLGATLFLGGCNTPASPPGFGIAVDGHPITNENLNKAKQNIDWPVSMVVFFLQWPSDHTPAFPDQSVTTIHNSGAIPVITWEPMILKDGVEHTVDTKDILSGSWDEYIDGFAQAAKSHKERIILRFAHEMNLARYHWGGSEEMYGPDSPARYQMMYRYVRERFRLQGADNVLFAFCPNVESLPHPKRDGAIWNTVDAYYPGDDAVDVLGMDGYNWGTTFTKAQDGWDSRFTSFAELFDDIRNELRKLSPNKPIVVFETASVAEGGDKTTWIEDAVKTAESWGLAALCWFQVNKERDWRLASGVETSRLRALQSAFAPDHNALPLPRGDRP